MFQFQFDDAILNVLKGYAMYWLWFVFAILFFVVLFAAGLFHALYIFSPPPYYLAMSGNDITTARSVSCFAAPVFIACAFVWMHWARRFNSKMQARYVD